MKVPKTTKQILWDVDTTALDPKKHKSFLIARITEKGRWRDVQWLKKQYEVKDIKRTVARSRNTSSRTKSFWKIM